MMRLVSFCNYLLLGVFQLDSVTANNRLVFAAETSRITPEAVDTFSQVIGDFTFNSTSYATTGVSLQFSAPSGVLVNDQNGDFFVRTVSSAVDYEYFELVTVTP